MSIIVLCVIQHPFWLTKSGKIHHAVAPTQWISSEQSCWESPMCEWPSARRVEVGSRRLGERKVNSYHSNLSSLHQCEKRAELKTKQTLHLRSPAEVWFLKATGSSLLSEACIYKWELAVQKGWVAWGVARESKKLGKLRGGSGHEGKCCIFKMKTNNFLQIPAPEEWRTCANVGAGAWMAAFKHCQFWITSRGGGQAKGAEPQAGRG